MVSYHHRFQGKANAARRKQLQELEPVKKLKLMSCERCGETE